ncbi:MAG TPA: FCD domain-containing protein, partial [Sphingomonas sp.]
MARSASLALVASGEPSSRVASRVTAALAPTVASRPISQPASPLAPQPGPQLTQALRTPARAAALPGSAAAPRRAVPKAAPNASVSAVEPTPRSAPSRRAVERAARIADQVYQNLRGAIMLGELEPGARLREVEVAAGLQVSRTPVREAISRLIGDRLVRELPTGGVEVADIMAEMADIYAIREALEICAGRLAALRIDEAGLARLDKLLTTSERTDYREHRRRADINQDFHLTIAAAAGAPRLAALLHDFRGFFLNPRWISRQSEAAARQSLRDHRAIIDGLRARDSNRTEQAIRLHLKRSYGNLIGKTSGGPE